MASVRVEKVRELIKQEVSKIIVNELKDPRVKLVTVTAVDITKDLRAAKIYISLYGADDEKAKSLAGLQKAAGFIRAQIGQRIKLRITPEIHFQVDKSLEYSEHIQKILAKINN
jgi:ribosome-binding factor A